MTGCAGFLARVAVFGLAVLLADAGRGLAVTTYYVRADGGSPAQCTGLADAAYPGEGTGQACAWDHPFRAFPPGSAAQIAGGDTLIVGSGSYRMGIEAPGDDLCESTYPWDCRMSPVPSGPDADHPTRILGAGWDQGCTDAPELWGAERADSILDLTGASHVEVACLELTDHLGCAEFHPKPSLRCERESPPYGDWASVGIYAQDAADVVLRNLNIHGFGSTGVHAGRLADWTVEDVRIAGNGWVGWDGDILGSDSNSGNLTFRRWTVEWNGCSETWPGGNPSGCWSQTAGGYGDGVGTGYTLGDWVIEDSAFLHNTSDGLDLLYLLPGASVTIRRTRAEGNAGNQIKTSGPASIENVVIVGNCAFFDGRPYTYDVDNCRALGNALSLSLGQGDLATVVNSTITGQGDCLVLASCGQESDGSESVVLLNNIFQGQEEFLSPTDDTCLAFADACVADPFEFDYSVITGVKHGVCPGENDICGGSAGLADARIHKFDAHLTAGSPAIDSGLGVGGLIPAEDIDGTVRPVRNEVDRGAYETLLIPTRDEQVCRKEIRKRVTNFFKSSVQALQRCVTNVNDGAGTPPCPDAETIAAIDLAASKIDPDRLGRKCPPDVLETMTFAGSCAGADLEQLATCMVTETRARVDAVIDVEYAQPDAELATPEQQTCQSTIAKQLKSYAVKRLNLLKRCLNKQDRGVVASCLDAVSQVRVARVAKRVTARLDRKCTDTLIQELQAAGGFGGTCAGVGSVSDLTACELAEHDAATDQVIGILQ